ncbi:MAG: hypothetical protein CBB87_06065 [Micavibrio sp. TMED27]|nr:hypothetical protein [Micavibrio sp.]OUT91578.1 MAG: hypothetical protein CBB87_06065 [Micavibrio sp. TMED27]|tara:strand:- start:215 stop:943 length:729 start_codon:yes stop_codon:yes gene_type:complete
METNLHSVEYGRSEIIFHLNFKDRKTLAIHVHPNCSVVVDAPDNTSLDKIKNRVFKRAKWIRKQQRYFERYPPALPARKYISGEAFRYLGRQYTLKIERSIIDEVKMLRGQLYVYATYTNSKHVKELVDTWYRNKANNVFEERFSECLKHVSRKIDIEHDGNFYLRAMKMRWGSCSKRHLITLNPELIGAPKECIDYVIVHELCHLSEHNHSKAFYKLLEKAMPDWEKRKDRLETLMEHRAV